MLSEEQLNKDAADNLKFTQNLRSRYCIMVKPVNSADPIGESSARIGRNR
jgi:hypothetical protein